jgi:hypothetical protein
MRRALNAKRITQKKNRYFTLAISACLHFGSERHKGKLACDLVPLAASHLYLEVRVASRDTSVPHTSAGYKRLLCLIKSEGKFVYRVNIIH